MPKRRRVEFGFPVAIARFTGLEGGQYGEIRLSARSPHKLELSLGDDFIDFNRRQARELRDAVQVFLALEPPATRDTVGEVVEEVVTDKVIEKPSGSVELVERERVTTKRRRRPRTAR